MPTFVSESLKERDHWRRLGLLVRIILKWDVRTWTGFVGLNIEFQLRALVNTVKKI
jgi:hypothetical protein